MKLSKFKTSYKLGFLCGIIWGWLICSPSFAVLNIVVAKGLDDAVPVAVVPFMQEDDSSWEFAFGRELASIVNNDLHNSGLLKTLAWEEIGQYPHNSEQVNFNYWRRKHIDYVVVGKVKSLAFNKFKVSIELVDIYPKHENKLLNQPSSGELILGKEFIVEKNRTIDLAHHISDLIYQKLTGIRGIFSTQIAYVKVMWRNHKPDRYILEVADSDGKRMKDLVVSKEPLMSPSWSPDGRKIAFVSFARKYSDLSLVDLDTGKITNLTSYPGINGAPAWSPDGQTLALVLSRDGSPKIYTYNLASKELRKLTTGFSIDTEPNWSPDGREILFTSDRSGSPQIYRYELASGDIRRMTFEGDYNAKASFTPDGKRIVMLHREDGQYRIAWMDLRSKELNILTRTALDESPSLAPNGNQIIYSTRKGAQQILAEVSLDGRVKLEMPELGVDVQDPSWSPFLG